MNYFVVTSLAKRTLRSCVPRGSPLFVSSQHVSSVMTRAVVASSNTRRYPNGLTCSFSSAADTDRVRMDQYRAKDSDEGVTGQDKTSQTSRPPKDAAVAVDDKDDDDEMEQEEMFVDPHESFEFRTMEWGGPRRGGRLPEPTRYGDWERKGRCTDF